jgi:iron-sulfur cluster assembly accessory protein
MVHIQISPAASAQVKTLIRGQQTDIAVRVYAQPGASGCGCGGGSSAIKFGMAFAKPRPDDDVVRTEGFSLLVDPTSSKFLDGAVIDYVESLSESGFKITNPTLPEPDAGGKAGGCGSCGESSGNGGGCGCG